MATRREGDDQRDCDDPGGVSAARAGEARARVVSPTRAGEPDASGVARREGGAAGASG
jgi:hypothetical protein